jgi:hypothetical protein
MRRGVVAVALGVPLLGVGAASAEAPLVVGPESVRTTLSQAGLRLELRVSPNRAAIPSTFVVKVRDGLDPVRKARVTARVTMPKMAMPPVNLTLREVTPGVYSANAPAAFTMVGTYELAYRVTATGHRPVTATLVDHVRGLRPPS